MLNLFLCDILKHNISLLTLKPITLQLFIIHMVVRQLKDGAPFGVGLLWQVRSRLRYKLTGFR